MLDTNQLSWYKDPSLKDKGPLGQVNVSSFLAVTQPDKGVKKRNCFKLVCNTRDYHLYAETMNDKARHWGRRVLLYCWLIVSRVRVFRLSGSARLNR